MKKTNRILSALLLILAIVFNAASCAFVPPESDEQSSVGDGIDENTNGTPDRPSDDDSTGGDDNSDSVEDNVDGDYANSYEEAIQRSKEGKLSGSSMVPDAAPTIAKNQPKSGGALIRNSNSYYVDDNTYVVVDVTGVEVFRIYRGGGYITLEEVAAYVYAFGDVPANYVSGKKVKPQNSIWGEYLRLNHSSFSGSTTKYPYEPELPNISGCGGYMYYYEIDIGTTGTDTGNGYRVAIYNDGRTITRGAARIVYTFRDYDRDGVVENDEKYVFYTYNHYNDFREYLNYYGGWGEMFGNVTGGGTLSSKYDYNPTPYVPTILAPISAGTVSCVDSSVSEICIVDIYYCIASKRWLLAA